MPLNCSKLLKRETEIGYWFHFLYNYTKWIYAILSISFNVETFFANIKVKTKK